MKICYCDESGTGSEPIAVMSGVIVDSQRMHVTKEHWDELLGALSRIVGHPLDELHTRDFYSGNGVWRGMAGDRRSEVISEVFQWLRDRKHHVVFTAVDKAAYETSRNAGQLRPEINTVWRFLGFHLILAVQRHFQKCDGTKGNTIFIFDNEERERMRFTDLLIDPPAWSDSYYNKGRKQPRLDQIVDVPYFGDSKHVALLQLADFIAYFLRRYAEISSGLVPPRYPQELPKVTGWIDILKQMSLPPSVTYPATGRCECAEMFWGHASPPIRDLQRNTPPKEVEASMAAAG